MRSGSIFVSLWDYVRENVWELLKLGLISGCKRDEFITKQSIVLEYILWFNLILGLSFICLCVGVWQCVIMSLKQGEVKFKPRIKLNHNIFLFKKSIWVLVELVRSRTQNFTIIDQEKQKPDRKSNEFTFGTPWLQDLLRKHWFTSSV